MNTVEEKRTYTRIDEIHNTPETALIVDNYPWGFRLRTSIRYWIESTSRGDRFCSQTIDPRTGKYCAPKKSTYSDVMVLTRDDRGYINYRGWSPYSMEELDKFIEFIQGYPLSPAQDRKIKLGRAYLKSMQHVKYECKAQQYMHKITGEISSCINIMELDQWEKIEDAAAELKQAEIKQDLNKAYGYYLKEEGLI